MDLSGEYRIPAKRDEVWKALNDPEILKQSIPNCEELTQTSDNTFDAKVRAKIGPVNSRFNGQVELSNVNAPESYTISGEGRGGAAGFAKGGADVSLREDGEVTVLNYTARAEVGGKLAQIGSRLVQGSAKKMAEEFFGNFSRIVAGAPPEGEARVEGEPQVAGTKGDTAQPIPTPQPEPPQGAHAAANPAARGNGAERRIEGGEADPAEGAVLGGPTAAAASDDATRHDVVDRSAPHAPGASGEATATPGGAAAPIAAQESGTTSRASSDSAARGETAPAQSGPARNPIVWIIVAVIVVLLIYLLL